MARRRRPRRRRPRRRSRGGGQGGGGQGGGGQGGGQGGGGQGGGGGKWGGGGQGGGGGKWGGGGHGPHGGWGGGGHHGGWGGGGGGAVAWRRALVARTLVGLRRGPLLALASLPPDLDVGLRLTQDPYARSCCARPRRNSRQAASSAMSINSSGWCAWSMRPGPQTTAATPAR